MYVRSTMEQLKEFTNKTKYLALLNGLGYELSPRSDIFTTQGHFKKKYKTKKNKTQEAEPQAYFGSVNQAMTIQSSKFEKVSLVILDELMNHFQHQNIQHVNKAVNLLLSVLRDHNCPIWLIFNMIDQNDIFLRLFKLEKTIGKVKAGEKKIVIRSWRIGSKSVSIRFLIYKPAESKAFQDDLEDSIAYKVSATTSYGAVANSDDFVNKSMDLIYIKQHGAFKNIININGYKIGLWTYRNSNDKVIYQFSERFNKTGRTWTFSYLDWESASLMGNIKFVKELKHKLIKKEVEFSNGTVFLAIANLLKAKA